MRLPKIGTVVKYNGKVCEVKALGSRVTLLEEGKKKAFRVSINRFSKIYEEELPFDNGEENGNGEKVKDVYAACVAKGEEHGEAVTNTATE